MNFLHYPVMHREIIDIFRKTDQGLFIDCTLGMGGHSFHILENFKESRVIGLDEDAESLEKAKINLEPFKERVDYRHLNYTDLFDTIDLSSLHVSGMLIDPGISIYQLKEIERGFSHNLDAPLDMRKNRDGELTAFHVINSYKLDQLKELFETYGEVRNAGFLARRIIEKRLFGPIETTGQLKEIVEKVYGWKPQRGKTHPAANVFQALRIVVNRELDGVAEFLEKAVETLSKGARIIFLSFHSVEDRILKQTFTSLRNTMKVKIIKPFPAFPSADEVGENNPSRSVKLRAVEII